MISSPFKKSKKRKLDNQSVTSKPNKRARVEPPSTVMVDTQASKDSNASFMSLPLEIQQYILIDISPMQSVFNFRLVSSWFNDNIYKYFKKCVDAYATQFPNVLYSFNTTLTFSQWKKRSIEIQLDHAILETLRLLNNREKIITVIENDHASDEQIHLLNILFSKAHNHLDDLIKLEGLSAKELLSKENGKTIKQGLSLIQDIKDFVVNITDPVHKRWIIKL